MSSGRVALVAGASEGIGRAIAERLADDGHEVIALARNADKLAELRSSVIGRGKKLETMASDAGDLATCLPALEETFRRVGEPTIFVHAISARYRHARLQSVSVEDAKQELEIGLLSAIALSGAVLRAMARAQFGRIVFLGSSAASMGLPGSSVYCAIKAGLEGLARGIAIDYAERNVTANTIALGMVHTERLDARISSGEHTVNDELLARIPQRRFIGPAEIAALTSFLVSDEARAITGSVIQADAGLHLGGATRAPAASPRD